VGGCCCYCPTYCRWLLLLLLLLLMMIHPVSVTADDHASWSNTINYEIVTKILSLFPRTIVD
ncbi:MAG: hypothetical protein MUF77_04125, partial [Leptospira sp.]|nr:hypothetical protein [Leptospira sp.]